MHNNFRYIKNPEYFISAKGMRIFAGNIQTCQHFIHLS